MNRLLCCAEKLADCGDFHICAQHLPWGAGGTGSGTIPVFGKQPTASFLMLPLVLPEIIVGVSLLIVLVQLGIELNVWTVILGHVLICMPFSIAILLGFQQYGSFS